jgi:hypothetical protein
MGRKLEWELSGKSDVPQKMAQAKASMEGVEGAANAVGKKFKEAFKDIALGFVAPMVLVQKAIGFIGEAIENRKRQVQEALDFADTAEAKMFATNQEIEAGKRRKEQQKTEEDKKKAEELKTQARIQFFREAPEGMAKVEEHLAFMREMRKGPYGGMGGGLVMTPEDIANAMGQTELTPQLQEAFDKFFGNTAAQRAAAEAAADKTGPTASKIAEVSGNVIGVGQSPQLDAMRQQIVLQEDMANSLRQLVEADQAKQGFRPERGFDLGGMGSSGRTVFPR